MNEPQEHIVVGPGTLERMQRELEELTTAGRDYMSQRLQRAREFGDIRENADYDAARDEQAMMEARIRQLRFMIKNAVVQEAPAQTDEVVPGIIVTVVESGADEADEYLVAATSEEKVPGVRTVTTASPLGKALLGKRPGDAAVVNAPGGSFTVTVVDLRRGR